MKVKKKATSKQSAKKKTADPKPPEQEDLQDPVEPPLAVPGKENEELEEQDAESPPEEKQGDGKKRPGCRCLSCKHYVLRNIGPSSSIVEDLRLATENWSKDFCGTKPVRKIGKFKGDHISDKIDCTGKKFEIDKA